MCDRVIELFDDNSTNQINFRDFVRTLWVFSERAPAEIKLEFAFRVFDFDGDGRISETDLFHVMTIMVGKQFPSQKLSQICAELIQRGQAPPQKDERKEEEKFQV